MTDGYVGGRGREQVGRRGRSGEMAAAPSLGPVRAACEAVVQTAADALAGAESHVAQARSDESTAVQAADRDRAKAETLLGNRLAGELVAARAELNEVIEVLSPGVGSCGWDAADWRSSDAAVLDVASVVRLGSLELTPGAGSPDNTTIEVPLLVPLLNRASIIVRSTPGVELNGLVQGVVLRSLAGTGPGQLEVHAFDPALRSCLAPFAPLRTANADLFPPALSEDEQARALLRDLSLDVRRITDQYKGRSYDLGSFREATGQPIESYQLVVLFDYPTGVSKETNDTLLTLLRTAPPCGISFLVHLDPSASPERDVDPSLILRDQQVLDLVATPSRFSGFVDYRVACDSGPPLELVDSVLERVVEKAKSASAPTIAFDALHPESSEIYGASSRDRITTPFGLSGHEAVSLTLGDETEQRHNVLISGAVGQGKSNLLMAIVHGFARRYAPSELEMYLLDFKDGVTLYPLAAHPGQEGWLPHAKVLGLESDREFGAAVLDHLVGEFERRATVMKPFGDNIARYRTAQPEAIMPRLLVVIDEFQVLFEDDDELSTQCLSSLEKLAKKGRAYGIHLILASQTLSGITGMLAKQDGIFSQFPVRLALKNSAAESRVVLDSQNTEASRLRYRGELIVNNDFGALSSNSRAVAVSAEPGAMASLRTQLWQRDHDAPPTVFDGRNVVALSDDLVSLHRLRERSRRTPDGRLALLGRPISVHEEPIGIPMSPETGRHVALVGAGATQRTRADVDEGLDEVNVAIGALQACALSLALQHPDSDATFTVFDLLTKAQSDQARFSDFLSSLSQLGAAVETYGDDDLADGLAAVAADLAQRSADRDARSLTRYVLAFGLDRARRMTEVDFSSSATTPVDNLRAILRDGPALGVHLMAWWANARTFKDHLGYEASGLVDGLALFRVASTEVVDLLGPFVTWSPRANRALLRDAAQSEIPVAIVPFAPLSKSQHRVLTQEEWDS